MIYHNYVYRKTKTLYEHFHAQLIHILTIENYSALYAIPIETPVVLQAHAEEIIEGAPLRICAERADIIICTSHYGASLFAALAPNSVRKIRVLHPAVDCEGYSVPTRASRHTSIVTVARLDSRKNIDTLIRAFGLLMHETPDATLTIIGDGPERNMLEALARKTAPGKILFTGWATEARKRELLGKARVFALCPRVRDARAEGFGIAFVEAQAAGTPVVGSDVGGVPESAGPHSILVKDPLNAAAIAKAIKTLWNNNKQWDKQHRAGLAYAKQFSTERYIKGVLAAYAEARAAHITNNDVKRKA